MDFFMLRDVPPVHLHDTPHLAGITVLDQHGSLIGQLT